MERYTESFVREMQAFAEAVLTDKATQVGGIDGRAAVVIGLAARRSYDERRPVRLDEVVKLQPSTVST